MNLSVAIDGPAGAGKSTIAKLLGKKFNLMYINTGAMYRAVTLKAIKSNIHSENIEALCKLIDRMEMHFNEDRLIVDGEDVTDELTLPLISANVSKYAAISEVRKRLVDLQRKISYKYNVIMDGRDIGTVVLKDAAFKFYLTAEPEERAKRRFNELSQRGINVDYNSILSEIIQRDYVDSHRELDPLTKAEDALEIDTSFLSIDQVVDKISEYIMKGILEAES